MTRVGFVSLDSTDDPQSGQNAYYMWRGLLESQPNAVSLSPLRLRGPRRIAPGIKREWMRRVHGQTVPVFASTQALSHYKRNIEKRTRRAGLTGLIFNQPLLASGSIEVPYAIHMDGHVKLLR